MDAYGDTVAWLSALEVSGGWNLGLDRMREGLDRRGNPQRRWPALHVAGTNGKGSTAAMLDAVLSAAGWRTGLYTSPHLVDFAERIRAGGRTIPHETVVELVAELRAALEPAGLACTHFEFTTLVAFEWFARIGVEVGVIEVGLGGRLDATNVLEPLATAITSIGHDHEAYLGTGLASIAAEKAGIAKPQVPLVIGRVPAEAERVIAARAAAVGAPLVRAALLAEDGDRLVFRGPGVEWDGLRLGLSGTFQRDNAAVALTTLAMVRERLPCPLEAVRAGLAGVRWPGRLAVVGRAPLVILDGAHNPEGAMALARELPRLVGERPVTLVFAVMADKDWEAMLVPLVTGVTRAVVTRVGRRGAEPAALAAALRSRVPTEAVADPRAAVRMALASAGPEGAVVVAGSLFLVGEAYAALDAAAGLFQPWKPVGPGATEARP